MKIKHLAIAAVTIAALALTGCSSNSTSGSSDDGAGAGSSGAFPVTVATKFGKITIDSKPKRIVALGWGDAETALALGVQPVGASDWLAFGGDGVGPWAKGLYTKSPKIIKTLEPSYEAIAALKPDLILDTKSSGDQDRYDRLASIAPTIDVPKDGTSYLTTMTEQMTMISTALGLKSKGEKLLADVENDYTKAAAANPEFDGKTVAAATKTSEGWGAYIQGSERVAFLEKLGFVQSPKIAALPTNAGGFSVDISSEQLNVLEADVLVAFPIYIPTTDITDDAQYKALTVVKDGHSVIIDGDLSSAYSLGTTLAVKYAISNLVPKLAKAAK
jgi:iron complex transport system substrate-binding protein